MAAAIERGIVDRIDKLDSAANPINHDASIQAHNPSGKVPTLITDDGVAIYDSRVICEYIDSIGGAPPLFPAVGPARWRALTLHAAADELLDAALLARYETFLRPEPLRWRDWEQGQMRKIDATLSMLERGWLDHLDGDIDIGVITVGCALGYLDFRFPKHDWRAASPGLASWFAGFGARPCMSTTQPPGA